MKYKNGRLVERGKRRVIPTPPKVGSLGSTSVKCTVVAACLK